jgi:endonuclease YncB( thermonuclease family)
MKTVTLQFSLHDMRVIDSDTVEAWVQVSYDIRQRWRIRLRGIEGGELGTEAGARGEFQMNRYLFNDPILQPHFIGMESVRDQHGRHVGDIRLPDGQLLTLVLLKDGTHWRRDRDGTEHPRACHVPPPCPDL